MLVSLVEYAMPGDKAGTALFKQLMERSTARWDALLDPHDLAALAVDDFEVIDHGAIVPLTFDCQR